jgi:hypothetical protein
MISLVILIVRVIEFQNEHMIDTDTGSMIAIAVVDIYILLGLHAYISTLS